MGFDGPNIALARCIRPTWPPNGLNHEQMIETFSKHRGFGGPTVAFRLRHSRTKTHGLTSALDNLNKSGFGGLTMSFRPSHPLKWHPLGFTRANSPRHSQTNQGSVAQHGVVPEASCHNDYRQMQAPRTLLRSPGDTAIGTHQDVEGHHRLGVASNIHVRGA